MSPALSTMRTVTSRKRVSLSEAQYEHIARPETQEEYYHGELRLKVPANPHATQRIQLAYVLEAHVAEGYMGLVPATGRQLHR